MVHKILVIPDIHGSDVWKRITKRIDGYNKFIFLGDYMDSFDDEQAKNAPNNLREIIEFKKQHDDKVILLVGNHDYQYINQNVRCSGYRKEIATVTKTIFDDNINEFKVFYKIGNILFSHAGFTADYVKEYNYVKDIIEDMDTISVNRYPDHIWTSSRSRGGLAKRGSCLWADWDEYKNDYVMGDTLEFNQIFGHTSGNSVRTLTNGKVSLYCLDTLAFTPNIVYDVIYDDETGFMNIDYINTLV